MSRPSSQHRAFVKRLEELDSTHDRGALAALRRGLGKPPGTVAEMFPYVVPWESHAEERHKDAYYLVAALFAWHPRNWPSTEDAWRTNLGASFAWLGREDGGEGVERRFVALLNARGEDLPDHLRGAIGLMRAREVPVDYARLLGDIQQWDRDDRRVQRAWARAFWGHQRTSEDGQGHEDETTADE